MKKLIDDIASDRIPLSQALRRSKVMESKIKNETFRLWLNKELEGYGYLDDVLPSYRKVISPSWVVVSDDWGRTQNLRIELPDSFGTEVIEAINFHRIIEGIPIVELQIKSSLSTSGTLLLPQGFVKHLADIYAPQLKSQGGRVTSGFREINKIQYESVIDQTKDKLLDTLMELDEQFPDLTNDMEMNKEDKNEVQNIITNNIYGSNNPMSIAAGNVVNQVVNGTIGTEKEEELRSLGVDVSEIEELKTILASTKDDKILISEKVRKWLGSVSASVAGRGLYEGIPRIIELVNSCI